MNASRRQKRVASLIKEELSRLLIETIQDSSSGLITITRVEMTPDLKTARISVSIYGADQENAILETLERKKGYLRKSIASKVKLKYNPMLIFSLDQSADFQERIEKLLEDRKKNEQ